MNVSRHRGFWSYSLLILLPIQAYASPPRLIPYKLGPIDVRSEVPKNIRSQMAATSSQEYFMDPKSNYVLVLNIGQCYAQGVLGTRDALTRDHTWDLQRHNAKIEKIHIFPLGTDQGVRIGDSPKSVVQLLGMPTVSNKHEKSVNGDPLKTGSGALLYHYPTTKSNSYECNSWYKFDHGHLFVISITVNTVPTGYW